MTRCFLVLLALACRKEDDPTTTETGSETGTTTQPAPTPTVRDAKFDAVVDVVLADLDANLASGVSIAVCEGGVATWVEGFGSADPDGEVPVNPDMVFQIGSTTKHMTSALVLQQVEDGRYGLDDTVSTVLPAFSLAEDPSWAEGATLRHLLSHQGGLVDYIDWSGGPADGGLDDFVYGLFASALYPMSPPGALWNYSNPNFVLAGAVVEAHDPAERTWPTLLTDEVFTPLGMTHSFNRRADAAAYGNYALSYGLTDLNSYAYGVVPMEDTFDPASGRPAGSSTWSTPSDMCKWGQFLLHGDADVLDDTLRAELFAPQVSTLYYDDHHAYGLGMFVWDQSPWFGETPSTAAWYALPMIEHGGNTLSFTSGFYLLPEQDVVISILSNGLGDNFGATADAIVKAAVDPWPAATGYDTTFDEAAIAEHVGHYFDPYNVQDVEITAGGAYGLRISMPVAEMFGVEVAPDLEPVSTDVWLVTIDGAQYDITFVDSEDGPSTYLRNRAFVATRAPGTARRAAPTAAPRFDVPAL